MKDEGTLATEGVRENIPNMLPAKPTITDPEEAKKGDTNPAPDITL